MNRQPFNPKYGSGQTVAVTSAAVQRSIDIDNKNVCISNLGTTWAYARVSGTSADALTVSIADYPIPPGAQRIITKSMTQGFIGLASAGADTPTVHVMTGEGGI